MLPQKVKRYLEGLHMLCIRWWKRKVIHGMFKWLGKSMGHLIVHGRYQHEEEAGSPEVEENPGGVEKVKQPS